MRTSVNCLTLQVKRATTAEVVLVLLTLRVAVMRETLRLTPTAPGRGLAAIEDTTLGNGKYFIKAGQPMYVLTWVYQKDPSVWGEDVSLFRAQGVILLKSSSVG